MEDAMYTFPKSVSRMSQHMQQATSFLTALSIIKLRREKSILYS